MNRIPRNPTLACLVITTLLAALSPASPANPSPTTHPATDTPIPTDLPPITVRARPPLLSPKAASLRLRTVSGRTEDLIDRSVFREAPRLASLRQRRSPGVTLDLLDRGLPERSPKANATHPYDD
jgi:hypothetical protein